MRKQIIILGRVYPESSDKPHQNQEIMSGGGIAMTIKASCYKDPQKVLKQWKRKQSI